MGSDGHLETTYGAVAAAADSLDRSRSFSSRFLPRSAPDRLLSLASCPSARVARSIIRSGPTAGEDTRLSRKNSTSYTYVHPVTAAYPSFRRPQVGKHVFWSPCEVPSSPKRLSPSPLASLLLLSQPFFPQTQLGRIHRGSKFGCGCRCWESVGRKVEREEGAKREYAAVTGCT
jgi:hypothetical protein